MKTKTLVLSALMAALTCVATMIIKIPTPTFGYIHPGDGFVLLSGILLGPFYGALAAGIGSMFADIFSGYASWAPATFIIKALCAALIGLIYRKFAVGTAISMKRKYLIVLFGGILGEAVMVLGYFLYETGLAAFAGGTFSAAALASGLAVSLLSIPFNTAQGIIGIVISLLLFPIIIRIDPLRSNQVRN
ncbi:MAG: ECF transporter S component [Lachnospiraceae bacterium]